MNCKPCKKNICNAFKGQPWHIDGKFYCDNKMPEARDKSWDRETIWEEELIEKLIARLKLKFKRSNT